MTTTNMDLTMHHTLPKILLSMKKSPVEYREIKIIDIRPAISRTFSRIGRNIDFLQSQRFSERKPEHKWKYRKASSPIHDYCEQHDTSHYQPQPSNYNQRRKYWHDRTK